MCCLQCASEEHGEAYLVRERNGYCFIEIAPREGQKVLARGFGIRTEVVDEEFGEILDQEVPE